MTIAALLAEMESIGIRLLHDGAVLRVEVPSASTLDPYRERIREHKPALVTLLALQDEILRITSVVRDAFDRQYYDQLWERWHALHDEEMTHR